MSTALNRTTKVLLHSVSTPDFPTGDWIIDPDLSAVIGFPSVYWVIIVDVVSLMDQATRDAVDAAALIVQRDLTADAVDNVEDTLRASLLAILDEINLHAVRATAILDAADGASNFSAFKTSIAAINDVPQRTIAQMKTAIRGKLGS